jgi:hypothetical protein
LVEFGRVTHLIDHEANLDRHVVAGLPELGDASSAKLRLFEGQENLRASSVQSDLSSDIVATESSANSFGEPVTIAPESTDSVDVADAAQVLAPSETPMLDVVRSMISTLATGVDAQTSTVSAYIIGRVGTQLQPGERPGLLVDAKPSRIGGNRESMWIQV